MTFRWLFLAGHGVFSIVLDISPMISNDSNSIQKLRLPAKWLWKHQKFIFSKFSKKIENIRKLPKVRPQTGTWPQVANLFRKIPRLNGRPRRPAQIQKLTQVYGSPPSSRILDFQPKHFLKAKNWQLQHGFPQRGSRCIFLASSENQHDNNQEECFAPFCKHQFNE